MVFNNSVLLQWIRAGSTNVTFPIAFTAYYSGGLFEACDSFESENMSRRQIQIRNKTNTGFNLYSAGKHYVLIGY